MKTPRIRDFDPNAAAAPELGSPLDNMPRIERPQPVVPETPQTGTFSTDLVPGTWYQVPGTFTGAQAAPVKRKIIRRRPFDIYEDQYAALRALAEAERSPGKEGGMSKFVRQGIDMYLKARSEEEPQ